MKIAIPKKGEQLTSVIKPLKTKSKRPKNETEKEREREISSGFSKPNNRCRLFSDILLTRDLRHIIVKS